MERLLGLVLLRLRLDQTNDGIGLTLAQIAEGLKENEQKVSEALRKLEGHDIVVSHLPESVDGEPAPKLTRYKLARATRICTKPPRRRMRR